MKGDVIDSELICQGTEKNGNFTLPEQPRIPLHSTQCIVTVYYVAYTLREKTFLNQSRFPSEHPKNETNGSVKKLH